MKNKKTVKSKTKELDWEIPFEECNKPFSERTKNDKRGKK